MPRPLLITLLIALLLLPSLPSPLQSTPLTPLIDTIGAEQYQGACRYNTQGWIYVQIHGDPYQRGYQHGYLLSREIQDTLTRWTNTIHSHPHLDRISQHLNPTRYQHMSETFWRFITRNIQRMYWDKWPQEYQDEITGIADGATAHGATIFNRAITAKDILAVNEMYEYLSKMERIPKRIHPFKTLYHQLRETIPEMQGLTDDMLLDAYQDQEPAHHCNGFIATGNATSQGQLVVGHGTITGGTKWWWNYYIALRWNVILDITPTTGNRFTITTSPGLIWSDEDYYQSQSGITFLETTVPQGTYDNLGIPLSIRARTAIQYANSVDDVLYNLQHRNDGCMNAVWLIGDAKTGEIARLDLGYQHSAVWRTTNGFYWSANNPIDTHVRLEKFQMKKFVKNLLGYFVGYPGLFYWTFRYHPEERDTAFKSLGDANYGRIDAETVKNIMLSPPISDWITDSKVSDTDMMYNNGLWAFWGNPQRPLVMTSVDQPKPSIETIQNTSWALVYGRPQSTNLTRLPNVLRPHNVSTKLWSTFLSKNTSVMHSATADGILYWTTPAGKLFAMNATTGAVLWQQYIGPDATAPLLVNDVLYIGWSQGITAISTSGSYRWMSPLLGGVTATPILLDSWIVAGDTTGGITAIDTLTGIPQARAWLPAPALVGSGQGDTVYASADDSCFAVSLAKGRTQWSYRTGGKVTVPPVMANGTVYVASWDSGLYALNASSGGMVWSFSAGWGFNAPLCLEDDRVYAASMDNSLYVLTRQGAMVWNVTTTASIQTAPVVFGSKVIVASDDGHVYGLDYDTGAALWWYTPMDSIVGVKNYCTTPLQSSLLVDEGAVFLGVNGTVFAVDALLDE